MAAAHASYVLAALLSISCGLSSLQALADRHSIVVDFANK
jgi:hypothetical protein